MGRENGDHEIPGRGNGSGAANDQVPETAPAATAPAEGDAATAPAAAPDPLAEALARAETLEREKAELRDRMLRVAADFDNFKKRNRKEMAEAESRGREALLKELLPVIDNLERAVAHASAADTAGGGTGLLEGVRMVLRQFLAALEKFEVRPFSALGEAFDPQFHAAVQQVPTADQPAGMVVEEFQRGYRVGARLLRPAMVAVATPPPAPAPSPGPAAADGEAGGGEQAGGGTAPPSAD
ncbi:MAG: nucleotide exchange factor GrpE [Deltaproteobacteria bacterium]|nr:nucleotide exchange factor GrpE [Deltaproteobacteria bacterium]